MSDDELRAKLLETFESVVFPNSTRVTNALMPVVREALADAWDEGWVAHAAWWGRHPRDDFQSPPSNPWRVGD